MLQTNSKKWFSSILLIVSILIALGAVPVPAYAELDLDGELETLIRQELHMDENAHVTEEEVAVLTSFSADKMRNIASLQGMEHAVYLESLFLDDQSITDLSPVKSLKRLKWISVANNNISDLSPLNTLTELRYVNVYGNPLNEEADAVIAELQARGVTVENVLLPEPAAQPIAVFNDAEQLTFEIDPFIESGTTMVQFRPLFEAFGLEIGWDGETRTVTGTKERLKIELAIGSTTARVNDLEVTLPQAPTLKDGNTMIPLRFVGEATGRRVLWNGEARTIDINQTVTSYNFDMLFSNDIAYEGDSVDGMPHGKGKYFYKGTLLYEGEVVNGVIEGNGIMYDASYPDSYYEGKFSNNRFHGFGKTIYNNGSYHIGEYADGMRKGEGKLYASDDQLVYDGMFQHDAFHGQGTFYGEGFKYDGGFYLGYAHGNGREYVDEELTNTGEWHHGSKIAGETYLNGNLWYKGDYLNGSPNGMGAFYNEAGELAYRGSVSFYEQSGIGILYYEDGRRYIGEVLDGIAEGQGVLKAADGTVIHAGQFFDGEIDENPEETAASSAYTMKQLRRGATHFVIDGLENNNLGLTPQQAMMFIELGSEEHLQQFNKLTQEDKIAFMNGYAQAHWGEVLGVDECFTFIVYNQHAYASATLSYEIASEDVEMETDSEGWQIFE
ncbi:stalk domain-containing protein [Paenibacillus chungangensis]|uniref:Stalk domain-containing protein n=1 Tax=Paenibacillus chungangensis TaxID=696535 RepID=A0ABW3HQY8_9BACL